MRPPRFSRSTPHDARKRNSTSGEAMLGEEAFDGQRVARFLRAPDGGLRIALVNVATGNVFHSLPLAKRTREELARVVGVVRSMREAMGGAPAPAARVEAPPSPAAVPSVPTPAANGWDAAQPGDRVRWRPIDRIRAKGVADVEGELLAPIRRASTTRFARIRSGPQGRTEQVWENQGALEVLGASGDVAATAPTPAAEPAPRPSAKASAPRPAVVRSGVDLDAAGLARPKRAKPSPQWHGKPEWIRALQALETVLPLLDARPVFDPARRVVRSVRAWIETGGERPEGMKLTEAEDDAMREAANAAQWWAASAVMRASSLHSNQPMAAYGIARDLAEALRFDAAGGNYAELLARAFKEPIYLKWYANNPRFELPQPPDPEEAARRVVDLAARDEHGWAMVDPEQFKALGRAYGSHGVGNISEDWNGVMTGHAPAMLRRHALELLSAKGDILEAVRAHERSPSPYPHTPSSVHRATDALTRYERVLLFDAARRAGLRSPADAARPILQAKVDAMVREHRATVARLWPRIEAILTDLSQRVTRFAPKAAAAIDAARAANKVLRVPQTAHLAELVRAELEQFAKTLVSDDDYSRYSGPLTSRIYKLEAFASDRWASRLRRDQNGNWAWTIPLTDAAYARPARELLDKVAVEPVADLAIGAIQAIGYEDARALAEAEGALSHITSYRGKPNEQWHALYRKPTSHNIGNNWQTLAASDYRPRWHHAPRSTE